MALCFVPEDEEKLARGWPHVIVPIDGHKTHIQLRLRDRNKFLLVNRGFHWIQEYPYNR